LSFCVLKLHVINRNCHDLSIDQIVNMIGHGCPSLNTLYMIEHHPHILKIVTRSDSPNEIKFGRNSIVRHHKQINLLPSLLTKKTIVLNIVITRQCLQFEDTIEGAHPVK
jgi:hypothetical protein